MGNYLSCNYNKNDTFYVYSTGLEDDSKSAHWGPGRRKYAILHYVLTGHGYFNGTQVAAGEGFVIHTNDYHEYSSSETDPWRYYWIIISEELMNKYAIPTLSPDKNGVFTFTYTDELLRRTKNMLSTHKSISHTKGLSYFFMLLSLHEQSKRPRNLSLAHVENAKIFVENNYNKKISIGDIADAVHIEERYLYNLFMRYEKLSPKTYLTTKRLDAACSLLFDTDLSVSEIARSVGFDDVCAFSKFFSLKSGMSPLMYRKKIRG